MCIKWSISAPSSKIQASTFIFWALRNHSFTILKKEKFIWLKGVRSLMWNNFHWPERCVWVYRWWFLHNGTLYYGINLFFPPKNLLFWMHLLEHLNILSYHSSFISYDRSTFKILTIPWMNRIIWIKICMDELQCILSECNINPHSQNTNCLHICIYVWTKYLCILEKHDALVINTFRMGA